MFLAAVAHYFSFSHKPFIDLMIDNSNCCASFMSMWDISDVRDDVLEHVRVVGKIFILLDAIVNCSCGTWQNVLSTLFYFSTNTRFMYCMMSRIEFQGVSVIRKECSCSIYSEKNKEQKHLDQMNKHNNELEKKNNFWLIKWSGIITWNWSELIT